MMVSTGIIDDKRLPQCLFIQLANGLFLHIMTTGEHTARLLLEGVMNLGNSTVLVWQQNLIKLK